MMLPPGLRELFHNVDPDSVDPDRDADLVIRTVLGSGTWEQVLWLFRRYGAERVREVVQADVEGVRTLPEPTRALWTLVLLKDRHVSGGAALNDDAPEDPADRWRGRRRVPGGIVEGRTPPTKGRTPSC